MNIIFILCFLFQYAIIVGLILLVEIACGVIIIIYREKVYHVANEHFLGFGDQEDETIYQA